MAPARSVLACKESHRVWEMNLGDDENMTQLSNRELEPLQPIAASRRAAGATGARRDSFPAWLLGLAAIVVGLGAYLLLSWGTIAFARQPDAGDLWVPALAAGGHGAKGAPKASIVPGGDTINVSGTILDSHKETIGEAEVVIMVNKEVKDRIITEHNGDYVSHFQLKKGEIQSFSAVILLEGGRKS